MKQGLYTSSSTVIWHRNKAQETAHICVTIEGNSFWESQKAETVDN